MPITKIDLTGVKKYIEQTCVNCGYKQAITLGRAAQATKEEPFALKNGDTITVKIDGGAEQTITFSAADFSNIGAATAQELVAAINDQITDAVAGLDASPDCVTIESLADGDASSVTIVSGTATKALGFSVLGDDVTCTRPVIGRVDGADKYLDQMVLRHCNGCGVNGAVRSTEVLNRTMDVVPDTPKHRFRMAVNALFQWMKDNGHVHPYLLLDYAEEEVRTPSMLADIDKSVIEIPMP